MAVAIVLGLLTLGACVWLGRYFKQSVHQATSARNQQFFRGTFVVMGYLAKADGQVSKSEIAMAEAVMTRFGFNPQEREQAIGYFRYGKDLDEAELQREVMQCRRALGRQFQLLRVFLEIQVQTVLVDGELHPNEARALEMICQGLGVHPSILSQIFAWRQSGGAQAGSGSRASAPSSAAQLEAAYALLEIDPKSDEASAKRVYRKALSANHPDRLMAKGLPESMIKAANEKTHEIQSAWQLIAKARGWRS